MKNTTKIDYNEIDKYKTTDIEYYDLLNRVCHIGFRTSGFDFRALFNQAEKQGKKIYLVRDRWNELFKENPSIDWEDQIFKEDVGIK